MSRPTVELHVREVAQLFDTFDPCPFRERDLDTEAEQYIVASVRELRAAPDAIVIHVDQAHGADDPRLLESAVHRHFARKVEFASRELRALLQRGWISLVIGLVFLVALIGISELVTARLSTGALVTTVREGLLICGWVAMWRPLEIFLYEWWPITGVRRIYSLLSRLPLEIFPMPHPTGAAILQEPPR